MCSLNHIEKLDFSYLENLLSNKFIELLVYHVSVKSRLTKIIIEIINLSSINLMRFYHVFIESKYEILVIKKKKKLDSDPTPLMKDSTKYETL